MKAAWFIAHSEKGDESKNKNNWETIHFQSLSPGEKFAKTDIKVALKYFYNPKMLKHALEGHWEGFNQPKNSKIKVIFYWDITSIDKNGKILGSMTVPKQKIQLHNGKGSTTSIRKPILMPFHGTLDGNTFTIFYDVAGGKKGATQAIWDADNNTIKAIQLTSKKSLQGGKWHPDGVVGYLRKK